MKIVIVGAGAMGSVYAGLLKDAGNDVTIVTRNQAHHNAIIESGLRITGASGDRNVAISSLTQIPVAPCDLIIVAVKARDVPLLVPELKPLLHQNTQVLTIQNGLGSADIVADAVGADRLLVGIAGGFGAAIQAPGHVHHTGMQKIQIGAYATNQNMAGCEQVVSIWQRAGFNANTANNILAMQWEKLICNVAFSAICTLTGLTVGAVTENSELNALSLAAGREAFTIARAQKIPLSTKDPDEHIHNFAQQVFKAKPSMLLDHEAKRKSEIEYINGAVPREAAKIGLAAPVNQTLTTLVSFRESGF